MAVWNFVNSDGIHAPKNAVPSCRIAGAWLTSSPVTLYLIHGATWVAGSGPTSALPVPQRSCLSMGHGPVWADPKAADTSAIRTENFFITTGTRFVRYPNGGSDLRAFVHATFVRHEWQSDDLLGLRLEVPVNDI